MMIEPPSDHAYIAALWEQPTLCLAFFGVQYHTEEGRQIYQEAGIEAEMFPALEAAGEAGLLLTRRMLSPEGPVLMQYWRSYADLDQWARQMPHTRWWRWLIENTGRGVSFYHEIYQVKTGEAIYERGARPVGPAVFCSFQEVPSGEGKSKQRQQRFAEVTEAAQPLRGDSTDRST